MNDAMRRELGVKMTQRKDGTNTCELTGACPYYKGLFDMPEQYRKQYCRRNYLWCGRCG